MTRDIQHSAKFDPTDTPAKDFHEFYRYDVDFLCEGFNICLYYIKLEAMRIEVTSIPPEFDRYSRPSDLLEACHDAPLFGYPPPESRWHVPADEWDEMVAMGEITVPSGPWVVSGHPIREREAAEGISLEPEDPDMISSAQKDAWRKEYLLVTDRGMPVHPAARLGVTTEIRDKEVLHRLGMATGIGRERRCGALNTGAMLLARLNQEGEIEYPVVTEFRNSKLRSSFPGGYVERAETIAHACVRESDEELRIVEACAAAGIPWDTIEALPHWLWRLTPSVTGPCTLNAWLAEHFLAIDATGLPDMQHVVLRNGEPDQIETVGWRTARGILADRTFLGAHKRALRAHLTVVVPQ